MNSRHIKWILIVGIAIAVVAFVGCFCLMSSLPTSDRSIILYIDEDDTADSVYHKLEPQSKPFSFKVLKTLLESKDFGRSVHPGRYEIKPNEMVMFAFNKIIKGRQTSILTTIPTSRTLEQFAKRISVLLDIDKDELYQKLTNDTICQQYGFSKETIIAMFIPNTYDIYWTVSCDDFLKRMKDEYEKFWTDERLDKASAMGLTLVEIATIASIVDEETNNEAEKPLIAGLYYNRYKKDMRLQADPTIRYALHDFSIRRVTNDMLDIDSPYNTYMHKGLPPGPIRIPSIQGLEAVLNYVHHDYLYMCAKEDFSGTHNFARTGEEHMANAARYAEALNRRGIGIKTVNHQ